MPKFDFSGVTARFTRDQREAAAEGLERLYSACDGASKRDYAGFNLSHATNPDVQDLVDEAIRNGEIHESRMRFALSVLNVYRNTQVQDLAERLWTN